MAKDLPKSISVGQLLVDIAAAIGVGNSALIKNSQTPLGLLAVKTADVTVNFEITSLTSNRGTQVGVRMPLFFPVASLSTTETTTASRSVNYGTIKLEIVGVAEDLRKKIPESGDEKRDEKKPDRNALSPETEEFLLSYLKNGVAALVERLRRIDAADPATKRLVNAMLAELDAIEKLLEANRLTQAAEAFAAFMDKYRGQLDNNAAPKK